MLSFIKYKQEYWARSVSEYLFNNILEILAKRNICNVIITGGSIARSVYAEMALILTLPKDQVINFYLSDERFGAGAVGRRNDEMVLEVLFSRVEVGSNIRLHGIISADNDLLITASRYQSLLPPDIDICVLTVAVDGHIASIFKDSALFLDKKSRVGISLSRKDSTTRISIGPRLLDGVKNLYLLAPGYEREKFLIPRVTSIGTKINYPVDLIRTAYCFIYD
jgi:6-phosphogluconolactonase/glucosamine-6-phosphate isomerase/deaminase